MPAIGADADRGHERDSGLQPYPRLGLVEDLALPAVDCSDTCDVVPARDEPILDERACEVGQPVGALGRDDDLDALQFGGGRLGDYLLAFSSFHSVLDFCTSFELGGVTVAEGAGT